MITPFSATPNPVTSPDTFEADVTTLVGELPQRLAEANALAAAVSAISAGTAVGIPYTFSTTTTDSDPGDGVLRLDNATQASATTIRADLLGADGSDFTNVLALFDDSSSTIKGLILLQVLADPTKWLLFSVSALASPSGYRNITVANVASSGVDPLTNNDSIVLKFTRTGDKGSTGADVYYDITDGAAFEIDPANGNIQTVTLGASRTPKATNMAAGDIVLLGIDDGTAYTITWTDSTLNPTWVLAGGGAGAPTLATSGYTWVVLWKTSGGCFGSIVGSP